MATIQEAIKRLIYSFTSTGAEKVVGDLNRVGDATKKVGVESEKTEKAALSLDKQFGGLERRFNSTIRAQQDYEKVQKQVNAAVAQNPALQQRANEVLARAAQHYNQVSRSQQAFATLVNDVNGRVAAASGSIGVMGQALTALGPIGIGVAATLGATVFAIKGMSDASHELAQKAIELRQFSEVTGLSTRQVQALRSEASKFALTGDEIQGVITAFTAKFNELRIGEGDLLAQVRRLNPEIALQMQAATNAADAMTLFGKALQQTSNIFERNALVKAGTNRGGTRAAAFLTGINVNQIADNFGNTRGLTDDMIKRTAELEISIHKASAAMSQNIASIFAVPTLEAEYKFYTYLKDISELAKNFSVSASLQKLFSDLPMAVALFPPIAALGVVAKAGGALLPGPKGNGGFTARNPVADRWGEMAPPSGNLITPQATLANLKKQADAMGEAATYADRLDIAQKQLAISGKEAGLSEAQLGKAAGVLAQSSALQALQARIGLLGELARADEVELATTMRINLERAKGVQFSDEEIRRMRERARLAHEYSQLPNQLGFERDQLGRTETEAAVAARLRGANLPIDLNSKTAEMIRFNEQLRISRDLASEFAVDFVRDLRNGVGAMQAFSNALNRIADKLLDMAVKNLVNNAFGNALSSLFGLGTTGGVGTVSGAEWVNAGKGIGPLAASAKGNVFGVHGIVPFAMGGVVSSPSLFGFGNGGVGSIAEAGAEAIMPLKRSPGGKLGVEASGGGARIVHIHSTYNIEGAVSEETIARSIRRSHAAAVNDAVTIAAAGAPARNMRFNQLGT